MMRQLLPVWLCLSISISGCIHAPKPVAPIVVQVREKIPEDLMYDCPVEDYATIGDVITVLRDTLKCEQDRNKLLREWDAGGTERVQ